MVRRLVSRDWDARREGGRGATVGVARLGRSPRGWAWRDGWCRAAGTLALGQLDFDFAIPLVIVVDFDFALLLELAPAPTPTG